jgi:hypothetical protein
MSDRIYSRIDGYDNFYDDFGKFSLESYKRGLKIHRPKRKICNVEQIGLIKGDSNINAFK